MRRRAGVRRLHAARSGTWWPLHTHSIGGDKITEVVVEEQVGGRIYERHSDGGEGEWGRVLAWEPPARFAMTWYPGHDDTRATRLEVRFAPEGDGTRVDLEHTGWEIFAERRTGVRQRTTTRAGAPCSATTLGSSRTDGLFDRQRRGDRGRGPGRRRPLRAPRARLRGVRDQLVRAPSGRTRASSTTRPTRARRK